jgi:hypothetical protein
MYLDSKTMDKKILDGQSQNNGTVRLCEEHLRQGGSQGVDLVVPAATLQEEAVPASVWGRQGGGPICLFLGAWKYTRGPEEEISFVMFRI